MGRANRFLAPRVSLIATGFPELKGVDGALSAKSRYTGNPVRPGVIAAAATPYPDFDGGRLDVLVTGGSQGARVMADVAPAALALLNAARARAHPAHHAGARRRQAARRGGVRANGLSRRTRRVLRRPSRAHGGAHLVVGRAGASTVSELAVIGRPSILVPFPHALDQDQAANAAVLSASGAATVVPQNEFTPERLAELLRGALADPAALQAAAKAAKAAGVADAAERLAELVMGIARPAR